VILRTPVPHGVMAGGPTDGAGVSDLAHPGPDDRRLELGIVAIVEPEYLLVIHVMPYRYRRLDR